MRPTLTYQPLVLVGSSVEGLPAARAVQNALEFDASVRLWTDDVFRLSQSSIQSLLEALDRADYAILIATADDESTVRGTAHRAPRDNVLLELGLAIGRLGPERTFLITPRGLPDFKLATDLLGYEPATFDPQRAHRDDWSTVMAPAVNKIRRELNIGDSVPRVRVRQFGFFNQLAQQTPALIARASEMDFYFIHSRRWRENNEDSLRMALGRPNTNINVYLPDLKCGELLASLRAQFSDGNFVPSLVADGFRFWSELATSGEGDVWVYLFKTHPSYSTYRIDDYVLTAMYPGTSRKQNVPAFVHQHQDAYWRFIGGDLELLRKSGPLTANQLEARSIPNV